MIQYHEPDETNNVKTVIIHPHYAIEQMKNYAYQHGYTYADDAEALHEFIAVNWAEWVEEKKVEDSP